MLSRNQSQRYNKVKLGLRTWLALAVGVWMIYQLRVFLNHKQSSESENGSSVKEKNQPDKLKLGRKGLVLMGSVSRKHNEEEEKLEEQSGDVDEEELDTVRFDDPMDEIDSLNDDDDDDSASTDQHGDEEDDSPLERQNTDKVGTGIH